MALSEIEREAARKQIEKENALRTAYRRKFGSGDVDDRLIMENLEDVCFARRPAFEENEANQPYTTFHRDGKRSVLLHIKTMATEKPLDEEKMLKELENNEE